MNWMFYSLILSRIDSLRTSDHRRSTPTRCFWKTLFSCWAQPVWKQRNSPKRCSTSKSVLPSWRPTLRTLLILSRAYRSSTSQICSANHSPYVERDSSISHTKRVASLNWSCDPVHYLIDSMAGNLASNISDDGFRWLHWIIDYFTRLPERHFLHRLLFRPKVQFPKVFNWILIRFHFSLFFLWIICSFFPPSFSFKKALSTTISCGGWRIIIYHTYHASSGKFWISINEILWVCLLST